MEKKKHFLSWYFDANLLVRILIGLVLGAIVGLMLGSNLAGAELGKVLNVIRPFGDLFIRLLWMIMVPVIFSTLVVGAASISPSKLGKTGGTIFLVYVFSSFIAVAFGLAFAFLFQPHVAIAASAVEGAASQTRAVQSLSVTLLNIVPQNIVNAVLHSPNLLGIIFFTLCFGTSLSVLRASSNERTRNSAEAVFNVFDGIAEVMIKMVSAIMQYAPIGVFALICVVFATSGPAVIGGLAVALAAYFSAWAAYIIIWYLLICTKLIAGLPVFPFIYKVKEAFFTAFVTRSSAATLPITLECAEKAGIPKDIRSFAIPLGATINMDGTAIYQGTAIVFVALSIGHVLTGADLATIMIMATLAAIGAAGVPGAGVIMLLMVMAQIGLTPEAGTATAAAYAMILGIDALMDIGRTSANVIGDIVYVSMIGRRQGWLEMDKWGK